jgi:hypothetical protein
MQQYYTRDVLVIKNVISESTLPSPWRRAYARSRTYGESGYRELRLTAAQKKFLAP